MADDDMFFLAADGAHTDEVKSVAALPDGRLLSCSRDASAVLWGMPEAGADTLEQQLSFLGHTGFVNAVTYHPALPFLDGEAAIITASQDKHVLVWNASTSALEAVLDGHAGLVRCVTIASFGHGDIVTGSWDKTLIVWDAQTGGIRAQFAEHENSVLGVAMLHDRDEVLSCSGDRTIRRWSRASGEARSKYVGHNDSVQCVCVLDTNRFLSGGNDAAILMWDVESAALLQRFDGHSGFIYSIAYSPSLQEFISTSEDHSLRVWRNGTTIQALQTPAMNWCVEYLPNGDIATAGGDRAVRVYTRDVTRLASQEKIDVVEATVGSKELSAKIAVMGGIDLNDIRPEAEVIATKGDVEGQRRAGKAEDGSLSHFAWCGGSWQRIGTIVSESGSGEAPGGPRQKQYHNGVAYDYVFSVDFNGMSLKLCYNSGTSIFDAAQSFIYEHAHLGIAQADKEAIEQHILNNIDAADQAKLMGGVNPAAASSSQGSGAADGAFSAYAQEAAAMRAQGHTSAPSFKEAMAKMQDSEQDVAFSTFAQEGAEIERQQKLAKQQAAQGTASSSAPSASASSSAAPTFKGLNVDAAARKINELTGNTAFEETVRATGRLAEAGSGANPADVAQVLSSISELYRALPEASRFPAVDLLRALASNTTIAAGYIAGQVPDLVSEIVSSVATATVDPIRLVTLRLVANLAAVPDFNCARLSLLGGEGGSVNSTFFLALTAIVRSNNANLKNALVAVLNNAAAVAIRKDIPDALTDSTVRAELADAVVSTIGQGLIFESDTALTLKYLEPLTLLDNGSKGGDSAFRNAITESVRKFAMASLNTKRDYGDAQVMATCRSLAASFNSEP